jgi:hypothetical protein
VWHAAPIPFLLLIKEAAPPSTMFTVFFFRTVYAESEHNECGQLSSINLSIKMSLFMRDILYNVMCSKYCYLVGVVHFVKDVEVGFC